MAFFRNTTSHPARAWAFVGVGVWREYAAEPGQVIEVVDADAPVFASQQNIFAAVAGFDPEPEPEPPKLVVVPPPEPQPTPPLAPVYPHRKRR